MSCGRCSSDICNGPSQYPSQDSKGLVAYIGDMAYVVLPNGDLARGPWAHVPIGTNGVLQGLRWEAPKHMAAQSMQRFFDMAKKFDLPVKRGTTTLGESAMLGENVRQVVRDMLRTTPVVEEPPLRESAQRAPVPAPAPLQESLRMQAKRALADLRPKHFLEAEGFKVDKAMKGRVNADLLAAGFDGNKRFQSVGSWIQAAATVIGRHGFEWDTVTDANLFLGDKGTRRLDIAKSNPNDAFSPTPVTSTVLFMQWTKMEPSGWFEVIAYLS